MSRAAIDVLIVDDHRVVRDGLSLVIQQETDMRVVGAAATGEQALALLSHLRPSVIIMDLQLPGISGLETIRAIRLTDTATPIIVLTMYEGDEDIRRSLDAGAATYLLKHSVSDDLAQVIRAVHAGERPLPAEVQERLDDRAARPTLSAREVRILELVLDGQRDKEIASTLAISHETVRVHMKNIYAKLDVHDRTEAIKVALRRGIVHIR